MNDDIELIKKKICEIIFAEREIIKRKYILYLEEVEQLNSSLDIQIWINNYRYIFTKYGKEDIDKLDIRI
jgi:hypothetical protein